MATGSFNSGRFVYFQYNQNWYPDVLQDVLTEGSYGKEICVQDDFLDFDLIPSIYFAK